MYVGRRVAQNGKKLYHCYLRPDRVSTAWKDGPDGGRAKGIIGGRYEVTIETEGDAVFMIGQPVYQCTCASVDERNTWWREDNKAVHSIDVAKEHKVLAAFNPIKEQLGELRRLYWTTNDRGQELLLAQMVRELVRRPTSAELNDWKKR